MDLSAQITMRYSTLKVDFQGQQNDSYIWATRLKRNCKLKNDVELAYFQASGWSSL